MKCLSLIQPWATLLVTGEKKVETRSWGTRYRGPLAIHASKKQSADLDRLCQEEPFRSLLLKHGFSSKNLPRGVILGTVRVVECLLTDLLPVGTVEGTLGDFRPGRYAWCCSKPTPLAHPVALMGKVSLFEIDDALLAGEKSHA